MRARILKLLFLMAACGSAWGQNCPQGIPSAGNPFCLPPNHRDSPHYRGEENFSIQPVSRWKLTWGAIASDRSTGDVGFAVGKFSKDEAKQEAMSRCAGDGAVSCKIDIVYHNQCAAIAWPWEENEYVGGTVITRSGPSIEDAERGALESCSLARDGKGCKIFYADCTKPVLVQ